jgi:hypothetical protein
MSDTLFAPSLDPASWTDELALWKKFFDLERARIVSVVDEIISSSTERYLVNVAAQAFLKGLSLWEEPEEVRARGLDWESLKGKIMDVAFREFERRGFSQERD